MRMNGWPTSLFNCWHALASCLHRLLCDSFIHTGGYKGLLNPTVPGWVHAPGGSSLLGKTDQESGDYSAL